MGNKCTFCEIYKPTNHLILPQDLGIAWIEFCEPCGNKNTLQRFTENGNDVEIKTIREIFDMATAERQGEHPHEN
jgi:hypothetical protein